MNEFVAVLKAHYGIECTNIVPQQGGWSALAYKVVDNKNSYFMKVYKKSRASTSRWTALIDKYMPVTIWLMQNSGLKGKIPELVLTKKGEYKYESEEAIYLLYKYIDGETIGNQNLSEEQMGQIGEIVAELHSFGEEIPVKTDALQEDFKVPFLPVMRHILDKNLDKVPIDIAELLNPSLDQIRKLMATVEKLSVSLQNSYLKMALCHTDLHNWNMMKTDEGKLMLIDWEGLRLAPVEADMMFLVDHPHVTSFLSVYRKRHKHFTLNREALRFYQGRRRLEDIWEFIEQLLFDEQGTNERDETKNLLANELAQIAK